MRSICTVLLVLALAPGSAAATDDPGVDAFAVAFTVRPDIDVNAGRTTIVDVFADARIHAQALSGRLDDLRVFDAEGKPVPHAILWPRPAPRTLEAVPFFLLPDRPDATGDLRVEIAESGAIVSVERSTATASTKTRWLLDLSAVEGRVLGLDFDWSRQQGDLLAPLQVEGSDDLATWTPIQSTGALVALGSDVEVLQRSEITLVSHEHDYLRIGSPGATLPELSAVRAVLAPATDARTEWWPISGDAVDDGTGVRWRYDLPGRLAIDALRPARHTEALFFAARLEIEGADAAPRRIGEMLVRERSTTTVQITGADVLILEPGAGAPDAPVPLEVRVTPPRIRFAATGPSPFSIAVGRLGLAAARGPAVSALREREADAQALVAEAGEMRVLAGDAARREEVPSNLPFWLALLAGLAVLAFMLGRLMSELDDQTGARAP